MNEQASFQILDGHKLQAGLIAIAALCIAVAGWLYIEHWWVAALNLGLIAVVVATFFRVQDSRSEHLLALAQEHSIDAAICMTLDLRIISFNSAAEQILGFTRDEVVGRNLRELWPDQGQVETLNGSIEDNLSQTYAVADRVRRETGYRRNGQTFPMEISLSVLPTGRSRIALVNIRDLSLFETVNHEAKRKAAFQNALLESSLNARLIIDEQGHVVEYNKAASEVLGFSREEMLGATMADKIIPENMREAHQQGLQRFLETGHGPVLDQRIEVSAIHSSGREFPIELTISPVSVDGQHYFSAEIRDISTRVEYEQEIEAARLAAESASAAKSNFLATMSHEIRTPLNAVSGILSLLRAETTDARRLGFLEVAENSSKQLLETISDVLDYSKIEAGKMTVENEQFHLINVIDEVVALFANSAYSKGLEIHTVIDPAASATIMGDRSKVAQILKNFISNAVKFTDEGSIVVRAEVSNENLEVSVEDTGMGIQEQHLAGIFEPFEQADGSDRRQFGGTGLGLSICRQLATLMDGEVSVKSVYSSGSRFAFTMPKSAISGDTLELRSAPSQVILVGPKTLQTDILQEQLSLLGVSTKREDALDSRTVGNSDIVFSFDSQHVETANAARLYRVSKNRPADNQSQQHLSTPIGYKQLLKSIDLSTFDDRKQEAETQSNVDLSGMRVLLAEDSRANQQVISAMLEIYGIEVDIVNNGIEAFSAVMALPYDLVLMDVQMPELDGISATKRIRNLPEPENKTPIIALTAKAFSQDRDECLAAGMNDFLTKPIVLDELIQAIQNYHEAEGQSPYVETDEPTQISLRDSVGDSKFQELIAIFYDEVQQRANTIDQAYSQGDWQKIGEEAHILKSTSATFGYITFSQVCFGMEQAVRNEDVDAQTEQWPNFSQALEDLQKQIN